MLSCVAPEEGIAVKGSKLETQGPKMVALGGDEELSLESCDAHD
jgi:hypothetical protein